ncbi:MAG: hypothetical protein UHY90_03600 [Treponema sp.]|nr:hypothetical protein [Spirochaetia bacterium]MDD7460477.1 hypothetical protein [Spirochaetales bacterium]MDY5812023.1 hypothetical protein [Treponema sp.]MEE1181314.1 hypothetical protein [Treponema sp.]
MAVAELIKNIFSKKEEEKKTEPSIVDEIKKHMGLLAEKCQILNESFEEEKKEILALKAEADSIEESREILAAKLEPEVLGRITSVSSVCELAIAGKESPQSLKKEIASLKAKMNQRSALK